MRIRSRQTRQSTEIPLTSFMDIMFLLLIFFMVSTSFHEETRAIEVSLPRAETPKVITIDEQVLTIVVSRDNRIFLGDIEVEPRKLREDLNAKLMETGFRHVIIQADGATAYQNVVAVVDTLVALDVQGISFAVIYGG